MAVAVGEAVRMLDGHEIANNPKAWQVHLEEEAGPGRSRTTPPASGPCSLIHHLSLPRQTPSRTANETGSRRLPYMRAVTKRTISSGFMRPIWVVAYREAMTTPSGSRMNSHGLTMVIPCRTPVHAPRIWASSASSP